MIDTLKIQISTVGLNVKELTRIFHHKLTPMQSIEKLSYIGHTLHSKFKTWDFYLTDNNLTATGSLNKLLTDNNYSNNSYRSVEEGLNQLETLLGIPLQDALIKRIDIGYNILLDHDVSKYLQLLATCNGFKRDTYGNETCYFRSKKKTLLFYDKAQEVRKSKKDLLNVNLLRYEIRFTSTTGLRSLGLKQLKFVDLYDPHVYDLLVEEWYDSYLKIMKITDHISNDLNFTSKSNFINSMVSKAVATLGGQALIFDLLQDKSVKAKPRHVIKKYITNLTEIKPLSPILLEELNSKMYMAYEQLLSA